jgi:hypothetical protein
MCIVLGIAVIGVTLYLLLFVVDQAKTDTKIITAALGAVGSILTNVVAAVYLRMNAAATSTLATFHARLVETHQALFGSVLASRIENEEKRSATLAALALEVTKHGGQSRRRQDEHSQEQRKQ